MNKNPQPHVGGFRIYNLNNEIQPTQSAKLGKSD